MSLQADSTGEVIRAAIALAKQYGTPHIDAGTELNTVVITTVAGDTSKETYRDGFDQYQVAAFLDLAASLGVPVQYDHQATSLTVAI